LSNFQIKMTNLSGPSVQQGKYSPKLGYLSQFQAVEHDPPPWWGKLLWKFKCPPKSKLFMWLLLQNKAPTWENLQKRSFTGPSRCALCKIEEESNLHLFLHCSFTSSVWREISSSLGPSFTWNGLTMSDALQNWLVDHQNHDFKALPLIICWGIWIARNHSIFEEKSTSIAHISIQCLKIFSAYPQKSTSSSAIQESQHLHPST
jgi:hypothetical protein